MFYGHYPHKLNAKNQVTLPAKFREVIEQQEQGKGLYLVQVDPRCLYLYTHQGLELVKDRLKKSGGPAGRSEFRRKFFASITPVDPDPHGRFVIPSAFRRAAQIEKDVIFIGNADRMELWAADQWEQVDEADHETYQARMREIVVDLLEW